MNRRTRKLAGVICSALILSPAFAHAVEKTEENSVTALLSIRNSGSTAPAVNITAIHNLATVESCQKQAFIHSLRNNGSWTHREVNVSCLQNGVTLDAWTCVDGNCKKIDTSAIKP